MLKLQASYPDSRSQNMLDNPRQHQEQTSPLSLKLEESMMRQETCKASPPVAAALAELAIQTCQTHLIQPECCWTSLCLALSIALQAGAMIQWPVKTSYGCFKHSLQLDCITDGQCPSEGDASCSRLVLTDLSMLQLAVLHIFYPRHCSSGDIGTFKPFIIGSTRNPQTRP